ncbi:MAG: phage portal protein [Gammaproteobacteria bacterium]|jgi:HK97 family phage portal protein|nr:phage portal protein [Gammaproteobacteria bacterium]|tara:strand:- start:2903 stop:4099 length:1197 start_codon:yes stop_codon:yes gene_type:complete
MAWYNFWQNKDMEEKLNPAQPYYDHKTEPSREKVVNYERAYEDLEIVNRGVNLIVDDASEIPIAVGGQVQGMSSVIKGIKRSRVELLLNKEPNPFQDISTFRRNLITDYLLDGNIFIYFDGVHMYHLPANKVTIHASDTTYIERFSFNEKVDYKPSEIIHIKDNSFYSIYRGVSRLKPALRTMVLMRSMRDFQDNFFKNGAVPGLVLKSPNTLSEKIKERMIQSWSARYRPDAGGRRPLILDGGIEIDSVSNVNFKELDFQSAIAENEKIILKALGIPPMLLDSGNNANIRPNMRMYYLETILPIVRKINFAMERHFGFKCKEDITDIPALQPELRDQSQYYSALVNTGIISPNEAREALGFDLVEGHDELRVPANIAGSAVNPDEGGRPPEGEDSED